MRAVRKQSINKYAFGKNNKINVFEFISECKEVYEVESMLLDEIKDSTNTYKYIFENIKKLRMRVSADRAVNERYNGFRRFLLSWKFVCEIT